MERVIIEVKNGVAYVVSIPVDIEVEIIDLDMHETGVYFSIEEDTNICSKKA